MIRIDKPLMWNTLMKHATTNLEDKEFFNNWLKDPKINLIFYSPYQCSGKTMFARFLEELIPIRIKVEGDLSDWVQGVNVPNIFVTNQLEGPIPPNTAVIEFNVIQPYDSIPLAKIEYMFNFERDYIKARLGVYD